jgi:16S rRNA (guanine527-N7)-methyltransferase
VTARLDLSARLAGRAARLFSIELHRDQLEKLSEFADLLERWNRTSNLCSFATREELVERHLLDSLAPAVFLSRTGRIADVGSGAGLPGIPLAIALPTAAFTLIEAKQRRVSFLNEVVRRLAIAHVRVEDSRTEASQVRAMDAAVGRGIRSDVIGAFAREALGPEGRLILMVKHGAKSLPPWGFAVVARHRYQLQGGFDHEVVELVAKPCST